jgi:hypothetical protein
VGPVKKGFYFSQVPEGESEGEYVCNATGLKLIINLYLVWDKIKTKGLELFLRPLPTQSGYLTRVQYS